MSVTTVDRRERWVGTGGLPTVFVSTIKVKASTDLALYHVDTSTDPDTITLLVKDVDFTVTLASTTLPSLYTITLIIGGGSFFAAGLSATEELRAIRNTQMTQGQSFLQGDPFPETVLELVADKLTLLAQDANDKSQRALRGADSDPVDNPLDMQLPDVTTRAQRYLSFDNNGEPTATTALIPPTEPVHATMSGFMNYATLAAARAHLEVEKWEIDTAANRALTPAAAFGIGLWYESDTDRVYYSDGVAWTAYGGIPSGLLAARPAFGNAGAFYYATDTFLLYYDTGAAWTVVRPDSTIPYTPGTIWGLNTSWTTATTMTVALGRARDDLDAVNIVANGGAGFPMTKQLNAAGSWVAGGGNNCFPNGSLALANNWYRVFLMYNPSTGAVDWGCDKSATAANITADVPGFSVYRRIGWIKCIAGPNFKKWIQVNDHFTWDQVGECYDDAGVNRDYSAAAVICDLANCPPNVVADIACIVHTSGVGTVYNFRPTATMLQPAANTGGAMVAPGFMVESAVNANHEFLTTLVANSGSFVTPGRLWVWNRNDPTGQVSLYTYSWKDDRNRGGVV